MKTFPLKEIKALHDLINIAVLSTLAKSLNNNFVALFSLLAGCDGHFSSLAGNYLKKSM